MSKPRYKQCLNRINSLTKYNKQEEITSIKHRNSKQNKRSGLSSDQHLCGYGTHRTFYFSALPRLIDLEYFPQVKATQLDGAKDDKAQADMK